MFGPYETMGLIVIDTPNDKSMFEVFYHAATGIVYKRSTYYTDHWRVHPDTLGRHHRADADYIRALDASRVRARRRSEQWFGSAIDLIGNFCNVRPWWDEDILSKITGYLRAKTGDLVPDPNFLIEKLLPVCDFSGLTQPTPTKNMWYKTTWVGGYKHCHEGHRHHDCGTIVVDGTQHRVEICNMGHYPIYLNKVDNPLLEAYIGRLINERF